MHEESLDEISASCPGQRDIPSSLYNQQLRASSALQANQPASSSEFTMNPTLVESQVARTLPLNSPDSDSFPRVPDFWDILFSLRHSITRNAIVVSVFMDLMNILQLAIVIIILFISRYDQCDIPLRGFLYFYSSRLSFSLFFALFSYINLKINLVGPIFLRSLDFLRLGIDILTIAIVVCGNYLVFVRNDCQFTSPTMFYTSFGLIVINYLTIAFPIFLLITLLMSGRLRSQSSSLEGGAPPEALEKTKLVRVRHLASLKIKETMPDVEGQPKDLEISSIASGGTNSPTASVFTTVSANGTSVLVVTSKSQNFDCSICLCPLEENDLVRQLVCSHYFHCTCIDRWFENHRTCPLCKFDVALNISQSENANRPSYLSPDAFLSLNPRIN
ncbi:hypothetical protein DSO57_1037028 [Entomophthora muscae]|uniref:Uncharacterized protein n=1 Tax=Entomophthora muscae TaxID=34485 RepID=A0ACC2T9S6_9FUNG|nr:hypothetical protein DSO57_1037028 [Entomophthora muscae]